MVVSLIEKLTLLAMWSDMNTAESEGLSNTWDHAIDGLDRLILRAGAGTDASYIVRLEPVVRSREWWRKHGRNAE